MTEHRGFVGGLFQFTLMIFLVLGNGIGWAIKEFNPDCDNCVQYTAWVSSLPIDLVKEKEKQNKINTYLSIFISFPSLLIMHKVVGSVGITCDWTLILQQ